MTTADLDAVKDIDATAESSQYLHIERNRRGSRDIMENPSSSATRKTLLRHALEIEQLFTIKQIATGGDEGIALIAEHDGQAVAAATARPDPITSVLRLIDLRVDFEFRRQGLASALMFQLIQEARQRELRAVMAQSPADDFPAVQLLAKLGFEPTGLDTHFRSNHDLVKESVVLFFYLVLN